MQFSPTAGIESRSIASGFEPYPCSVSASRVRSVIAGGTCNRKAASRLTWTDAKLIMIKGPELPIEEVAGRMRRDHMGAPSAGSLDRALALSRVGGDAELLKEIAMLFLEEYPRVLDELRNAIARGDARSVERTAHGLKGSVSNF